MPTKAKIKKITTKKQPLLVKPIAAVAIEPTMVPVEAEVSYLDILKAKLQRVKDAIKKGAVDSKAGYYLQQRMHKLQTKMIDLIGG